MDPHVDMLARLVERGTAGETLFRGSPDTRHVEALQRTLYELGFETELAWSRFGADGDYGAATAAAVAEFARRNGFATPGDRLTPEITEKLVERHALLAPMRRLRRDAASGRIEEVYRRGSGDETAVAALQTALNALGYGRQLGWATFGADGHYGPGTARAVRAFAASEGVRIDGDRLDAATLQRMVERLSAFFGDAWETALGVEEDANAAARRGLRIEERVERGKTRVYVSDGTETRRFTRLRLGLYTLGDEDPRTFIEANRDRLAADGVTDSAINVMIAVSDNEGCLDAVNTWDNAFLSFGIFQWTAGTGSAKGELPALLRKIERRHPDAFERHFGRFGLGVVNAGSRTGYFALGGERLDAPAAKNALREPEWAFRFCVAGGDPAVQAMEIVHALARLGTFYDAPNYAVDGHPISALVTSEYGVALLLDNHVNRPGYVRGCLEQAYRETALGAPRDWSDQQERRLIESYLRVRRTFGRTPMTHADQRAQVTRSYLERGVISERRGSFARV